MDIREAESKKNEFDMHYKTLQLVVQKEKFSKEEIEELLLYWESKENYEYCEKILKIKSELNIK